MFAIVCLFYTTLNLASSVQRNLTDSEIIRILNANITANASEINDELMLEYLYGNQSEGIDPANLDTALLETGNIRDIVAIASRKSTQERDSRQAYYGDSTYSALCMDLMKQSVYGTRYRLQATKRYRKKYGGSPVYQIGILYGALMQLRLKMDSLINTVYNFDKRVKFLWHLVIYERLLMINVDVNSMVERMFAIQAATKVNNDEEQEYDIGTTGQPENDGVFFPGG